MGKGKGVTMAKTSHDKYVTLGGFVASQEAEKRSNGNGANLGFENKLWLAADKMRNNMDSSEYKHVVLGLIFLKYISDAFEERRGDLLREASDPESGLYVAKAADRDFVLEDRDEYTAENVFWVPREAR